MRGPGLGASVLDRIVFQFDGTPTVVRTLDRCRTRLLIAIVATTLLTVTMSRWAHAAEHESDGLEIRLYLQGGSYHFDDSDYDFTNFTPGIALETGDRGIGAVGAYRNSVRTASLYVAAGYRPLAGATVRPFGALALVWGYHHAEPDPDGVEVGIPALVPLPVLGIDTQITERLAVRVKTFYPVVSAGIVIEIN